LTTHAHSIVEERVRIYYVLHWLNNWMDHERWILSALIGLNVSELGGHTSGAAAAAMVIGVASDFIPAVWLADHYHRRAVAAAERSQHPVTLGIAYLGLAIHEHHVLGQWDSALDHYRRSAAAYWEAGELREWGILTLIITWALALQGDLTQSIELSQEVLRIGQDAGDNGVLGSGCIALGKALWQRGALEEGAVHLREATETCQAASDYQNWATACGELGQCYLRQGKLNEASAVLEEGNRLIDEHGLRSIFLAFVRNNLAEARLMIAEQTQGAERHAALRKAKRACKAARNHGRIDREGAAGACRLQGTFGWLSGKPDAARKWWQRSLTVAEELGARYDLGLTHAEMGKRLKDRGHLERAVAIFTEIGAEWDVAQVRVVLEPSLAAQ
jgi:tetratricopeptide (TPR) repeat protein